MGFGHAPQIIGHFVRMTIRRISIFPLTGAILFPGMQLPLHIFEQRYRDLVGDSLARDRMIGMIQPKGQGNGSALFEIGCLGRIGDDSARVSQDVGRDRGRRQNRFQPTQMAGRAV